MSTLVEREGFPDSLYDPDNDEHYIHKQATRTMTITTDGAPQMWVHIEDFMKVQAERDNHRRALAFINAARVTFNSRNHVHAQMLHDEIDRALKLVGMGWQEGKALASLIASVVSERAR